MTAGKRTAEQFEREHTHEQASLVLPDPIPWAELEKPVDYAGNVLGNRFLERGCGLILFGPAGLGKSTALLQANAEWSAGLPAFHIEPVRALKIILIQTEDSLDDTRETLRGVFDSSIWTADRLALVRENLVILPPVPGGRPEDLGMLLTAAALRYKPDIVAVNPLLAFCPDDPTRELGRLLYQHIDPVLKRHGLAFAGAHHTPKTFNRNTAGFGAYDSQGSKGQQGREGRHRRRAR